MAPADMHEEEINQLSSSLREVIMYIKYASDEKRLELLLKQEERFRRLDADAAQLINVLMNCGLEFDEGKETVDMCKAIDDMRRHAWEAGEQTGLEKGERLGLEKGILVFVENLMKNKGWSCEEAMDALGIAVSQRGGYAERLGLKQ